MSQPCFVGKRCVGQLDRGVFFQRVSYKTGIIRRYQAKGIDVLLYRTLQGKARVWRIEMIETKEKFEIAFDKIEQVGIFTPKSKFTDGDQFAVPLAHFNRLGSKQAVLKL